LRRFLSLSYLKSEGDMKKNEEKRRKGSNPKGEANVLGASFYG
jgi:hypothetical protein